ncbi:MAG: hypothetical protein RL173_810 [Fibrobacterota bacterium]|jgi:hypothetical protein
MSGMRFDVSVAVIRTSDDGRGFDVFLERSPDGYRVVDIKDTWIS